MMNRATTDHTANALNQYSKLGVSGSLREPAYDADGNLIAEYEVGTVFQTVRTYTWGTDLSGTMQGAGGVGGLLSTTDHSATTPATYYYTYDTNGNVGQLIDTTGSTVAHYELCEPDRLILRTSTLQMSFKLDIFVGPFGQALVSTGTYSDENPFRFSTKYTDNETDLLYYGYRYYDPETGRWLNRDPIGERGGVNVYGFVYNDPLYWIDDLGNKPGPQNSSRNNARERMDKRGAPPNPMPSGGIPWDPSQLDDIGRDAANEASELTNEDLRGREFFGWICRHKTNGHLYRTEPEPGTITGCFPKKSCKQCYVRVASYHSHSFRSNWGPPSYKDHLSNIYLRIQGYVGRTDWNGAGGVDKQTGWLNERI